MITTPRTLPRFGAWGRRLLIGVVLIYAAFLILAPIAALIAGAIQDGIGPMIEALGRPQVRLPSGRRCPSR